MDLLKVYICAIKLDKSHFPAWLNLAVLYEQNRQLEEALKCYKTALGCYANNKKRKLIDESGAAGDIDDDLNLLVERIKSLNGRIECSKQQPANLLNDSQNSLPSLSEAFSLETNSDVKKVLMNRPTTSVLICNSDNSNKLVDNKEDLLSKLEPNFPFIRATSNDRSSLVAANGRSKRKGNDDELFDLNDYFLDQINEKQAYLTVKEILKSTKLAIPRERTSMGDLFFSDKDLLVDTNYRKRSLLDDYLRSLSSNDDDLDLNPDAPGIVLQTKSEAHSPCLLYFCLSHPISVVRRIDSVLDINLELFTTKSLLQTDSNHSIEIRYQRQQASDENWDTHSKKKVWSCESTPSSTSLAVYAQYQADTYQKATNSISSINNINNNSTSESENRKHMKQIRFGTNVDLSDEAKWHVQLKELEKLPSFMRIVSSENMLSHVGYKIFGVNTLQMYLKVPGSRTPGHQENNSFCSLNLNIGPGDCEWFGTDEKYWPLVEELCERNGTDYLKGSWWPNNDDLKRAKVPYYRFIQKPGDLVWVNYGTVHWVQSIGWCNNISWNIGPMVFEQYKSAVDRYEWNRRRSYKSIIPMIHLSWNLARNAKIDDEKLYKNIKIFIHKSIKQSQRSIDYAKMCNHELKHHPKLPDEPAYYCFDCSCEVFNILFVYSQISSSNSQKSPSHHNHHHHNHNHNHHSKNLVYCLECARKISEPLKDFIILYQYSMDELKIYYDKFCLNKN